jgi:hypothetical protein
MKSVEWKTYRTRFLIKAKQLNSALSFTDPLGRTHCGRKGDYLVESYEGVLSIAPRQIFEDIYVAMMEPEAAPVGEKASEPLLNRRMNDDIALPAGLGDLDFEDLPSLPQPLAQARRDDPVRVRRKLPQPCRDRRSQPSRLSLM